jgi:hypothetical protein
MVSIEMKMGETKTRTVQMMVGRHGAAPCSAD